MLYEGRVLFKDQVRDEAESEEYSAGSDGKLGTYVYYTDVAFPYRHLKYLPEEVGCPNPDQGEEIERYGKTHATKYYQHHDN